MERWMKICLILCAFGFFKEMRPSEPFLTQYLLGPPHNLTESEVYFMVYPVWTYSYLSILVVVFLFTDLLCYKPVIIFEGLGYTATWCLLIWGRGVRSMQAMEFFYGISTSTEVAYYTYIYAMVDTNHFQKVTSYTRTAILTGRFAASILAQALYSTGIMSYYSLNFLSLASVLTALIISTMLPPAKKSIYFHKQTEQTEEAVAAPAEFSTSTSRIIPVPDESPNFSKSKSQYKQAVAALLSDFKEAYTSLHLLKWSIWWAFAACMNFQVGNYIQPLWEARLPSSESTELYNGVVEGLSTLFGALSAFSVGYLNLNWKITGEALLAVMSTLLTVCLLSMGYVDSIMVAYVNYILFRGCYMFLITIVSFQVASDLKAESYGLVFGFNMFMALSIESILTVIVIEIYEVDAPTQFIIYGYYFAVLAILFIIITIHHWVKLGWSTMKEEGIFAKPVMDDQSRRPRVESEKV